MKTTALLLIIILLMSGGTCIAADPAKIRPYTGIGIFPFQLPSGSHDESPLFLYDEPGLSRLGSLDPGRLPAHGWIFGPSLPVRPLIVTARKGDWLRTVYDDAGREAWLRPPRPGAFQSWENFFKSQVASVLPGLQKRYLHIYQKPNRVVMTSLTPRQPFKVLRLEGDWAMVVYDQSLLGWLRWRDEDGRLLIGISSASTAGQQ